MSSFAMLFFTALNLVVIGFIIVAGAFYVDGENWTGGNGFFPYGASGVRFHVFLTRYIKGTLVEV